MYKLILYYSDDCSHCRNFKKKGGQWNQLKKMIKNKYKKDIIILEFDVKHNVMKNKKYDDEKYREHEVNGVPTLVLEKDDTLINYDGSREVELIMDWLSKSIMGEEYEAPQLGGGIDFRQKYYKYKHKYMTLKNKLSKKS